MCIDHEVYLNADGTCPECRDATGKPFILDMQSICLSPGATIVKTWPAFMEPGKVIEVFTHDWGNFYYTLGRGRPTKPVDTLFFTHRGRLLGHFDITRIVQNVGQLPKLRSVSDEESEWQIKLDAWVAICPAPFHRLDETLYYEGFRGWRYFDLEKHRSSIDSKVRL